MYRKLILCLCVVIFSADISEAQDVNKGRQSESPKQSEAGKLSRASKKARTDEKVKADKKGRIGKQTKIDKQANADKNTDADKQADAKELSGMSIVGNDEAPKSLYIVPWKSSEIGTETNLDMMLNDDDAPVDRDVFKRKLEFYQISTTK
jgi:hypothetical protein